jgi:DNA-binding transcriptional MerR regulator
MRRTDMPADRPARPEPGTIASVLHNLRRAPKRVRRQSREYRQMLESAVAQLFDAAARHPHGVAASDEYRIDDLARLAGTTTRNIRVYRDRGLLPPPLRVGRIALYNDTHLTRLRLITSMLDRGYNIAHVREMLSAWEEGKNLGDVLGLETAIVGTWATEKPETMPLVDAGRLVDDPRAFERLVALQLIRVDGGQATVNRPKLIEAFNEIHGYGVDMDELIDLHEQIVPEIDKVSDMLVRAGAEHVMDRIKPGRPLPEDAEIAELITMLIRFRTQAVASVAATLASSIESSIESLVSRVLADYLEQSSAEPPLRQVT